MLALVVPPSLFIAAAAALRRRAPEPALLVTSSSGDRFATGVFPVSGVENGRHATTASLRSDWVLTHEMIHTALPELSWEDRWFEEGLATCVEPIARARVGLISPSFDPGFGSSTDRPPSRAVVESPTSRSTRKSAAACPAPRNGSCTSIAELLRAQPS